MINYCNFMKESLFCKRTNGVSLLHLAQVQQVTLCFTLLTTKLNTHSLYARSCSFYVLSIHPYLGLQSHAIAPPPHSSSLRTSDVPPYPSSLRTSLLHCEKDSQLLPTNNTIINSRRSQSCFILRWPYRYINLLPLITITHTPKLRFIGVDVSSGGSSVVSSRYSWAK